MQYLEMLWGHKSRILLSTPISLFAADFAVAGFIILSTYFFTICILFLTLNYFKVL